MKRILLVLFVLVSVSSVFAADLKVSGDFMVRGQRDSNFGLVEKDEVYQDYFDYDLNLDAAIVVNENAKVVVRLAYDRNVTASGFVSNSDGTGATNAGNGTYPNMQTKEKNNGLAVERAYISYKLHQALTVDAGLMAGGQWGTLFGNTENNVMRVKLVGGLSPEMVFLFIYQKDAENGNSTLPEDNEKDDATTYYLASVMKFGTLKVMPLLVYNKTGVNYRGEFSTAGIAAADTYDFTTMSGTLALSGDFGMVGFEAEAVYTKTDKDDMSKDYPAAALAALTNDVTTMGAYFNVWANVAPAKVGFIYAYASADEKDGTYSWGEDFDIAIVMDDFVAVGTDANLKGWTAYKLYGSFTTGAITADASVIYGVTNRDWTTTKDAKFTEIDLGVSFALDAATTYSIAGGYAMTSDINVADVDADAYRVYHKIATKF
jgi:hypothetical protein